VWPAVFKTVSRDYVLRVGSIPASLRQLQTMALKILPPIHEVLDAASMPGIDDVYRTRIAREALSRFRKKLVAEPRAFRDRMAIRDAIVAEINRETRELLTPFPRRVINGTGVLLHTNIGRAPLGNALDEIDRAAFAGYTDLEWDAESQKRASRDRHLGGLLRVLTGGESAIAVNNGAGALLLVLNTLAREKAVLVSRSELVEIGGGFRVPEIMEASGCHLVEVGTTNKTRLDDYAKKVKSKASVLLKVHQSNFVQRGFVESVSLSELAQLGKRNRLPVVYDNGSGMLFRTGVPVLKSEPTVEQGLKDGAGVVVCSADKLLGSVQAGLIVGKAAYVEQMRRNPLYRALRLDKLRLMLLHYALKLYLTGCRDSLPLWQMTTANLDHCRQKLKLRVGVEWVATRAQTGGGSNPEESFESLGLRFSQGGALSLKQKFASRPVPILGYIQGNAFYVDVRTLLPGDFEELQKAIDEL
jgi:L-seryl-tRNA(Ser) seleniumtransferase